MSEKNSKKLEKALADIGSSDSKLIAAGIKSYREVGTPASLSPFFKAIVNNENEEALELGKKVFFDLKDKEVGNALFDLILSNEAKEHQSWLISALWEAGIDCKDRLEDLVGIAAEGDTHTVLEVLTVIENMDHSFPYDEIMDHKLTLNESIEEQKDPVKNELLASLCLVLDQMTE